MIAADDTLALWTSLLALAAAGFWFDRTRLGGRLSGVVLILVAGLVLSNLNVLPMAAPVYDHVWTYLVPLAIPLLLVQANLALIVRESGPTLLAFLLAALATLAGVLLGIWLVPLGPETAKLAGIFAATYIGGSVNFAAVASMLALGDDAVLAASLAADNLGGTLYLIVLMVLPSLAILRRFLGDRELRSEGQDRVSTSAPAVPFSPTGVAMALALSGAIVLLSRALAASVGLAPSYILLVATALTVALATLVPRLPSRLPGAYELGTLMMYLLFGTIGAGADLSALLTHAPQIMAFVAIILTTHLCLIILLGRLFRLTVAELVIASNAAVMGPAPAAALAGARGWRPLVTPAVLCGVLGYALANFIGTALAAFLG